MRPKKKAFRRCDYKITTCLTEEGIEALETLMTQNPNQTKSTLICAAIIFFHTYGKYGYDANLRPLAEPVKVIPLQIVRSQKRVR